jgi:hypothetical protein
MTLLLLFLTQNGISWLMTTPSSATYKVWRWLIHESSRMHPLNSELQFNIE